MDTEKTKSKGLLRLSPVEKKALAASAYDILYPPTEKMASLVVNSFPMLGQVTALRFLEWVQGHPGGVISLPTGKTPEIFYQVGQAPAADVAKAETEKLLADWGIDPAVKPDMKSLYFVQIDEFYPNQFGSDQQFCYYVKTYYLKEVWTGSEKGID